MDPASIIGMIIAFVGVYVMMYLEGTHLTSILLPAPMIIVFVGTIGVGIMGSTIKDTLYSYKQIPRIFTGKAPLQGATIPTIVTLADKARREGLLALEDAAKDIEDQFLKEGLTAAIDGADPEDLRIMLEDKIDTKRGQDKVGYSYFNSMGGYAPTIGIVGTVISLVHVLGNLDDPSSLGPMIAAAFVATFWGLFTANLIWLPFGGRLKRLSELECTQMEVTLEGLLALQSGANPRSVGERLRSLVPPSEVPEEKAA